MKITEGVFLEILTDGKLIKRCCLRETGEEFKRGKLIERIEPYLSGAGDVELNLEDLDTSGYSEDTLNVYRALKEKVTFGKTITYGDLGKIVGKHPRFVAYCMRINRFPVIIPCHRVVSKNGPGGFSYGLDIKKKLLSFESSFGKVAGDPLEL